MQGGVLLRFLHYLCCNRYFLCGQCLWSVKKGKALKTLINKRLAFLTIQAICKGK